MIGNNRDKYHHRSDNSCERKVIQFVWRCPFMCIKALFIKLIYALIMDSHKLIHKLSSTPEGLEASLLLEEITREYVLEVNIQNENRSAPTETVLLSYLTSLHNYYQSLITPPIVAAPQVEFVEGSNQLKNKRSAPGMGKLNGRSMLKIKANGEAGIVGQLFRQLYRRQTYGIPCFSAESDLGKTVQQLFKTSLSS